MSQDNTTRLTQVDLISRMGPNIHLREDIIHFTNFPLESTDIGFSTITVCLSKCGLDCRVLRSHVYLLDINCITII